MYAAQKYLNSLSTTPMPTIRVRPAGQAATPCPSVRHLVPTTLSSSTKKRVLCTRRLHVVTTAASDLHGLVLVPVRFQLVASSGQATQDYRLTGSGPLFGGWDVQQAPRMTNVATLPDGSTLWAVQFDLLPGSYTYKVWATGIQSLA